MDNKKRVLFGSLLLAIIAAMFLSGYFCGKIRSDAYGNNKALAEVMEVLDKYYYKDVSEEEVLNGALKGAASSLGDPYTYYYEYKHVDAESFVGVGISTIDTDEGMYISSVYSDSPAANGGLIRGDVIYGVDDLEFPKDKLSDIKTKMAGDLGAVKKLKVKRGERKFEVEITLAIIYTPTIETRMLENNVGYLKINEFAEETPNLLKTKLKEQEDKGITKLVIDVRDNPGGLITSVSSILREFLTGNDVFLYMEYIKEERTDTYRPTKEVAKNYEIKILVNENSASAAEVFALAMNRIMGYDLIGKKTFGKGIHQADVKLESIENTTLHVTRGYWYGPDKEAIHGQGINPTIEVDLPEYYDLLPPVTNSTYQYDDVDFEIANIQLMLETLGYETRTDGYFDEAMKNIIMEHYESETLTYEVMKKIYDDYKLEIVKDIHDTQLMRALD